MKHLEELRKDNQDTFDIAKQIITEVYPETIKQIDLIKNNKYIIESNDLEQLTKNSFNILISL